MRRVSRASVIATLVAGFLSILSSGCGNTAAAPPPIGVSLSKGSATVEAGTTAQFSASVTNDQANAGVNWTVSCPAPPCGSVSPTHTASGAATTFTPPASQAGQLTVSLTAASASDPSKSEPVLITIPAITIALSSTSATVQLGAQAQFSATVTNDGANAGVNWTVSCPQTTCGGITLSQTPSGTATTYKAPAAPPAGNLSVTLTATSVTDSAVAAAVAITIPGIIVTVSPGKVSVESAGTQQFSASVSGDPNNAGVTWQLDVQFGIKPCGGDFNHCPPQTINPPCNSSCGSISATSSPSGGMITYTAASTPPYPPANAVPPGWFVFSIDLALFALSQTNSNAYSGGYITVLPITVSVSPTVGTVALGGTAKLTPTVINDATNSGVSWTLTQNGAPCSPVCGMINPTTTASGVATTYTAPATTPASPFVTVTATSVEDPVSLSATATATLTLTTASGAAACSTGSGNESLLKGQYAFLLQGVSYSNVVNALLDTTLAGGITADGTGRITTGEEDISSGALLIPGMTINPDHTSINPAASVYAVGPDRRGCLILAGADGTTVSLRFALSSNTNSNNVATGGRMIGFDSATGEGDHLTGNIRLQDPTSFAAAQLKGNYVMEATGSDLIDGRFAAAGTFAADGVSAITSGTFDVNDAGALTSDLPLSTPAGSFTCCSANGRGTLTLQINLPNLASPVTYITWNFYMVDSSDAFLDTHWGTFGSGEIVGIPSGTVFAQASISGTSVLRENARSTFSPIVDIATADADGNGTITVTDKINAAGTFTSTSTVFTYVVGANGRVALSGGSTPTLLYLDGQNEGFLLGGDANVTVGILEPQAGGPFSNASFAGSYVLGTENPSASAVTTQSGVLTADGGGNVTGTSDQANSATLNADQIFNFSYSIPTNGLGNVGSGTTAIMISPNKLAYISNTDPNPTITVVQK